ncbi:MAG: DUF4402 domain-containing protein [Sphingomicrobium sp.]
MFALVAPATLGQAAPPSAPASATGTVLRSVTVTKLKDLDFGILSSAVAGTAVIEPNADVLTTTGGVLRMGGTAHAAQFGGSATKSAVVNIKVPNQPVTLTRVGGPQTMTVSNFTLQGQNKRTIAAQTFFTFRVGGTLNVAANQTEGTYLGTFNVTVQYP